MTAGSISSTGTPNSKPDTQLHNLLFVKEGELRLHPQVSGLVEGATLANVIASQPEKAE